MLHNIECKICSRSLFRLIKIVNDECKILNPISALCTDCEKEDKELKDQKTIHIQINPFDNNFFDLTDYNLTLQG